MSPDVLVIIAAVSPPGVPCACIICHIGPPNMLMPSFGSMGAFLLILIGAPCLQVCKLATERGSAGREPTSVDPGGRRIGF
jgi:hypothetical protein